LHDLMDLTWFNQKGTSEPKKGIYFFWFPLNFKTVMMGLREHLKQKPLKPGLLLLELSCRNSLMSFRGDDGDDARMECLFLGMICRNPTDFDIENWIQLRHFWGAACENFEEVFTKKKWFWNHKDHFQTVKVGKRSRHRTADFFTE
jgi:hypothetical protein